ncbi:MAG: hypothetical protein R6U21_03940 [Thermoplasmatota archaeon]
MNKPEKIIIAGLIIGLVFFSGFRLLNFLKITPIGKPLNDFFSVAGLILFFISGFFYISLETLKN